MKKILFLISLMVMFLAGCNITIENEVQQEETKDKPVETEEAINGSKSVSVEPQTEEEKNTETKKFTNEVKNNEETMELTIYFSSEKDNEGLVDCRKTEAVTRTIPKTKAIANAAIEQLFIGLTKIELSEGLVPFNRGGQKKSDVIKRIFVIDDTIYVDWYDFSMKDILSSDKPFFYNSSSGGCNVIPPLEDTFLQFPNIKNIVYAFEGDPAKYYNWNQVGCNPKYNGNKCDPIPFQ